MSDTTTDVEADLQRLVDDAHIKLYDALKLARRSGAAPPYTADLRHTLDRLETPAEAPR